jgi:membrane protein implicated in regulation of membrane protease activity
LSWRGAAGRSASAPHVSPPASRTLTIVAAAVLAFDGAALLGFGVWSGRMMLVLVGVVFFVSALLVLLSWRWYRRRLADITAARRALGDEARAMQRSLREK